MREQAGRGPPGEAGPLLRIAVLTGAAVSVGAAASLAAIAFVELVHWLNAALLVSPRTRVQYETVPGLVPLATVAVPTLGGLLVGLLLARSPERRPLGPPEVVRAVQFREALPSARAGAVSTAAAAVSLGFGASVGQYGPMVYLGAMAGGAVGRLTRRVPNLPAISMACGVAAAIATAFNAPIAGLVFAHEVVLRHWATQAFAPTTVAAAVGYVIANVVFERPPLFLVSFAGVEHAHEFALFAFVGVLSAGLAMLFMWSVLRAGRLAAASGLPPALRPAAAGLGLGLTALWLPDVLGIGIETLRFATIEGAFEPVELVLLILAKLAVTALCIGFGFAGGTFSPALLIGVLLGTLCWTLLEASALVPVSSVAAYALCAMMATASPVIGAPLTTILIVFELTRNYDVTTGAMVAVVFSNLVAHRLFGRSLFDVQLARRGIDLSAGRDQARLEAMPVARCLSADFVRVALDEPLADATRRLRASEWLVGFATDGDGAFRGLLREPDAMAAGAGARVGDLLRPAPLAFDEETTVMEAMRRLEGFVGDAVPVLERGTGRLLGVVTEAAVLGAYLEVSRQLREEENAAL
jgi:CIC family chloride channel protein